MLYFRRNQSLATIVAALTLAAAPVPVAGLVVVKDGQAKAPIFVDTRGTEGKNDGVLRAAAAWLAEAVKAATGAELTVVEEPPHGPAVVFARAEQYPDMAARGKLARDSIDAFAVVTAGDRVYILGRSEVAVRHGVATLLRRLGFRYFNPSPRWWIAPEGDDLAIDETFADAPVMRGRRIWYAYGVREPELRDGYSRWAAAMRLGSAAGFRCGHSYHNIYSRNREAFDRHPELFALREDGSRQAEPHGKFCFSNPKLIELVVADRIKLLEESRQANPYDFMVSVDPSDGRGTCHCPKCAELGTTTDRVIFLANQVAKGLRAKHPKAWVGLYAYSTHRLPPTITVEPNVYVQVAMGFNRTQYTLPQLVSEWANKVSMIGLREYYGVEAWDWGLPGRMRGASVAYHSKWIPFYCERNVNAVNAETNANWGGQTLGLMVASHLMWDPSADEDAIIEDYFAKAFGGAAAPMRELQAKFDANPPLRVFALLPMFCDVEAAYAAADRDDVSRRVIDIMAYLHYLMLYRDYSLAASGGNDAAYAALKPLMQYAWQTRLRGMVHYYALARRLCNAKPLSDKRPEFHMYGHGEGDEKKPAVWQVGEELGDEEIVRRFRADIRRLEHEPDPYAAYSPHVEWVTVPEGEDGGPSRVLKAEGEGVADFRHGLSAMLVTGDERTATFTVEGLSRSTTVRVLGRGDETLVEKNIAKDQSAEIQVELPRAGDYHVRIRGSFRLRVPHETPLVFDASADSPAWISYSGPNYFYVPKGAKQLVFDCGPRLSLIVPGQGRRDFTQADRVEGKGYVVLDVPEGAAGQVWRTSSQTRGTVQLINVPPQMSFYRDRVVVPRDVAQGDDLTIGWSEE